MFVIGTRTLPPEGLIEEHVGARSSVVAAAIEAFEDACMTPRSRADATGELPVQLPPKPGLTDEEERARIAPHGTGTPVPSPVVATLLGRPVVHTGPEVRPCAGIHEGIHAGGGIGVGRNALDRGGEAR